MSILAIPFACVIGKRKTVPLTRVWKGLSVRVDQLKLAMSELVPVGIDVDGTIKPIGELKYESVRIDAPLLYWEMASR